MTRSPSKPHTSASLSLTLNTSIDLAGPTTAPLSTQQTVLIYWHLDHLASERRVSVNERKQPRAVIFDSAPSSVVGLPPQY